MLNCAAGDIHGAMDRMYEDVLAFEAALGVRFDSSAAYHRSAFSKGLLQGPLEVVACDGGFSLVRCR